MEGNYESLETFLDLGLVGDTNTAAPDYCAYYLLRGKLDAGMERVKNKKDLDDKRKLEILAYMYRAKGDLKAAVAEADKLVDLAKKEEANAPENQKAQAASHRDAAEMLAADLLFEAGAWKELAKRFQLNAAGKEIEKLGYGAAYHRLAGNQKEFDETIAAIIKYAESAEANDKATTSFYAAKALFLNDRPEEALKVLKADGRPEVAFEILCVQLRFGEAFEILEEVRKTGGESALLVEIHAARTLYSLGEKDKAKAMFAKLAEGIKQGAPEKAWFEDLVATEMRVGLREDAFEHATQILDQFKDAGWPSRLFPRLFPGHGDAAKLLFTQLLASNRDLKPGGHLKTLRTLMDGKMAEKDFEKLLTDAEAEARMKTADELDRWILALTDMAFLYKKDAMAQALLEKSQTAASQQRLGDLYAEKMQWDKAAEQYKAAWEKDKHQALALYFYGLMLTKSGKEAEGKKLMEQSHWLALGDEEARDKFAMSLGQRGQAEASRRENELLLRTSQPGSYYAGEAYRATALDALAKKQYLQAADSHEMAMLRCLRTDTSFLQNGAYIGVPTHIHRLRARAFVAAGKFEEARKEIAVAQSILPGDMDLAIMLVPDLEKSGQANDAKDIFDKTLATYEKLCKEYPKCAMTHNWAAWLSVCCGRNLEAAKAHALKATELAPTNAGHLDTLAEIYFQLGDKDKASATEKKVIDLEPKRIYFRKQLKRIEAGNPKAERPPENDEDD